MIQEKKKLCHTNLLLFRNLIYVTALSFSLLFIPSDSPAAEPVNKLLEIQNTIKAKLQKIDETRKKEDSTAERLKDINKSISDNEKELQQQSREISRTETKKQELSQEITLLTDKLESNKLRLKELVTAYYKRQYNSNALMLLSADDYQDLIRKSKYANLIASYDSHVINQYTEEIKEIQSKKKALEKLQKDLKGKEKEASEKRDTLLADRLEKDRLLAALKSRREAYELKVKELETSSQRLQVMLENKRTVKIPESILGNGFKSLKGTLPWPVNGKVVIPFGEYKNHEFNTTVFRKGIEIRAEPRDIPLTVAGGRVVYADEFRGYGKLVIIDHGNGYHSLYGNLSEVLLQKDSLVVNGFKVGKVREPLSSDVPTLYFEIRHMGRPVNPAEWLQSRI